MADAEKLIQLIDHIDRELLRIVRYSDRISRAIRATARARMEVTNLLQKLRSVD